MWVGSNSQTHITPSQPVKSFEHLCLIHLIGSSLTILLHMQLIESLCRILQSSGFILQNVHFKAIFTRVTIRWQLLGGLRVRSTDRRRTLAAVMGVTVVAASATLAPMAAAKSFWMSRPRYFVKTGGRHIVGHAFPVGGVVLAAIILVGTVEIVLDILQPPAQRIPLHHELVETHALWWRI